MNLLIFHSLAIIALAQQVPMPELVTDRPDQTESAVTVPPGMVQLEVGATLAEDDGLESVSVPETLMRLGLSPRVELRLGWEGFEHANGSGRNVAGDGELGLKLRLWDERGARPEAALLAGFSLPTGARERTSNRLDPSFRFSFAHTLHDRVSLGYNLGAEWATEEDVSGDARTSATGLYTLSLGLGLTERVGGFIELFGDIPLNTHGTPAHSIDGGFTVRLRENVQWDIAGGAGLNEAAQDWFVTTGLSVRFGNSR